MFPVQHKLGQEAQKARVLQGWAIYLFIFKSHGTLGQGPAISLLDHLIQVVNAELFHCPGTLFPLRL